MKKILAIILIMTMLLGFASCGLIRKATSDSADISSADNVPESETYATDFSDSLPEDTTDAPIKYTEDQAYELLSHSFPDYDMDHVEIEKTGEIIAENDGTEYYIFNVALPVKAESETETSDQNETKDSEVEMEDPVPYYVSVNGVVHTAIGDNNVTNKDAAKTFFKKYGETDKETGFSYKLLYEGIVKSGENICYDFSVYKVNTSGEEAKDEYAFNYLVTIDGKLSAESKRSN